MDCRGWIAGSRGQVAEWQTRTVQVRVSVRTWGFNSPLAHTPLSELLGLPDGADPRPLIDWHELWKQEAGEDWIVEPLIAERRGVVIYSRAKLGKSLLMLEIATAIAAATHVLGVKIGRARRVLYVDFENDPGGDIRPRRHEWAGAGPVDTDGGVRASDGFAGTSGPYR